jgi:hypothetical protein
LIDPFRLSLLEFDPSGVSSTSVLLNASSLEGFVGRFFIAKSKTSTQKDIVSLVYRLSSSSIRGQKKWTEQRLTALVVSPGTLSSVAGNCANSKHPT